ncbi:MAG: hypothetical protein ACR2QO_24690 [Acidimicrobiales bacterium]
MSDDLASSIEDRLRDHYRQLREDPPPARDGQRPPLLVVAAACVAALLAAGAAYLVLQSANPGQPLETELGPAAENRDDTIGSLPAPASDATIGPQPGSDPPATADGDQAATTTQGPPADPAVTGTNVDGSPLAPTPGTVAPPDGAVFGVAYGIWEPGEHDTCSKEIHDSYWVYGPDGKVYPTYHPPVDPATGCTFGHEHGRDPAGSHLADIPFPFGYVNEQAMMAGAGDPHEDHVGHKIEWYNDGGYYESGRPNTNHDQICDVAYKLHVGSHSDEAFGNNTHEVFLYARCQNGSELIYRALQAIGNQGEFNLHCDQQAGPAVAVGRSASAVDGRGSREIPASQCFEDRVLVGAGERSDWFPFNERWTLYHSVDTPSFGRFFIQLQLFTDVPSRYWDGESLARTVDLCYLTGERQVRDDEYCEPMRAANPGVRVPWDHPASPFDGADRTVFMGDIRLDNNAQQTDWYTDVNGGTWSTEPFAGSIHQHVGTTPIAAAASYRPDPLRSITFDDGLGLHAPN